MANEQDLNTTHGSEHSGGSGGDNHIDGNTDLTAGLPTACFMCHTQADGLAGAEKAFDDNLGTNYVSANYPFDILWQTPGAFIGVEFLHPQAIAGITLKAPSVSGPPAYNFMGMPAVFEIQVSDDGIEWQTLDLVDHVHGPHYMPYESGEERFIGIPEDLCPGRPYKFMRLAIHRTFGRVHNSNNNPVVYINEMEVHPYIF